MLSVPSSSLGPANGSQETITTSSSQATTTASENDKDVSAAAARLIASLNELVGRDGRLVMGWRVIGKLVGSLSDADDRVFDDIVKNDQMKEHRQVLEQMAESLEMVSSKMRLAEKRRVDRELAQSKKRAEELDNEMRQARQAWEKRREEMQEELNDAIVKRDQLTGDLTTVKAAKRKLEADGKMLQAEKADLQKRTKVLEKEKADLQVALDGKKSEFDALETEAAQVASVAAPFFERFGRSTRRSQRG